MNNITLKQIRAFVAVATECSFTRAASTLHLTQSTLTSSIKALEDELEVQMFDRSTRSVVLTHQGELFLPAAQRMLCDLSESLDDLRIVKARERGSVSVCAAGSFITYVLSPALIRMASDYPGIHVRLTEGTTESVTSIVESGQADFGVTTLFEQVTELDNALLLTDSYGAVCCATHPLNADDRRPITWNNLSAYTMVRLSRANGIRRLLDKPANTSRLLKGTAYEVSGVAHLRALLGDGFGYSILPGLAAKSLRGEDLRFHLLSRPTIRRELYVVKKKGRSLSPAAAAFFRFMVEALEVMEPDTAIKVVFQREGMQSFCET